MLLYLTAGVQADNCNEMVVDSWLSRFSTRRHDMMPRKVKLVYTTSNCNNLLAKMSKGKLSCMRAQRML